MTREILNTDFNLKNALKSVSKKYEEIRLKALEELLNLNGIKLYNPDGTMISAKELHNDLKNNDLGLSIGTDYIEIYRGINTIMKAIIKTVYNKDEEGNIKAMLIYEII